MERKDFADRFFGNGFYWSGVIEGRVTHTLPLPVSVSANCMQSNSKVFYLGGFEKDFN